MILGTRHTGLVVRDLKTSLAFYKDVLGLQEWKRAVEEGAYIETVVGISGVRLEWVKLRAADGSVLELIQYHSHPETSTGIELVPSNRLACPHVAFTVRNVNEAYGVLKQKGCVCKSAPQLSPDGAAKVMYCHDPDGIILELVEEMKT